MTTTIEREDLDTDEYVMEADEENGDFDLDFSDILDGCTVEYHRDDYVIDEDFYSLKKACDACGHTWTESKDD